MRAMLLETISPLEPDSTPLSLKEIAVPRAGTGEVLIRVAACGVCHTEIDEIEGRTIAPLLPIVPGHEVVGTVENVGPKCRQFSLGDRVGVGWIYHSSGTEDENLSSEFRATGRDVHGGYAEYMVVDERYAYGIPEVFSDIEAAPLLCAGGVGYRALRLTGLQNGQRLGLTGFGGSAHLVLQLARHRFPECPVYVFARDEGERAFALELGAAWAGDTEDRPPRRLHAIIDTTPAWRPVLAALRVLRPGGRLVINAIRKGVDDRALLAGISYEDHLWMEKELKTVANVTARDIREFLAVAAEIPIRPEVQIYSLEEANQAITDLRFSGVRGAKVLKIF